MLPGSPGQRSRSFPAQEEDAFSETGEEEKWRWGEVRLQVGSEVEAPTFSGRQEVRG